MPAVCWPGVLWSEVCWSAVCIPAVFQPVVCWPEAAVSGQRPIGVIIGCCPNGRHQLTRPSLQREALQLHCVLRRKVRLGTGDN